jgi:hypothetical protein
MPLPFFRRKAKSKLAERKRIARPLHASVYETLKRHFPRMRRFYVAENGNLYGVRLVSNDGVRMRFQLHALDQRTETPHLVGKAIIEILPNQNQVYIHSSSLLQHPRGSNGGGIGFSRALFNEAIIFARKNHIPFVTLKVEVPKLKKYYKDHGFHVVGKKSKDGKWTMRLDLKELVKSAPGV